VIIGKLNEANRCQTIHPGFAAAFQFLQQTDLHGFVDGKRTIDGERLFAVASRDPGKGREKSLLEYHQRFIDIQYIVEGTDQMGWHPTELCHRVSQAYDSETDLGFFYDRPTSWVDVPPDYFAIFFPEDAHAPMAGDLLVHKIIVKIAVDW
jgi:biofilm protein TabA